MSRLTYGSVAISITALVVSLGGAAFSATGGNFILGKINSASNQSGIVSPVNGKMLLLNNTSTSPAATALGLTVKPGHPPMIVNSDTKVPQLNADKLDDFSSGEFSRIFAFKRVNTSGTLTTAASQFFLAPAFTASEDGRCLVIASSQVGGGASTGDRGPFYRAAIKRDAAAPVNDGHFGHYFPPIWGNGSLVSPELTRSAVFDVNAGEVIQFGVFAGSPPASWAGRSLDARIVYYCTTVSPGAGPASKVSKAGVAAPDMAAIQQDRQAGANLR